MSSYWSMYVVPDAWTLRDCMCIGYMVQTEFMLSKEEHTIFREHEQANFCRLYDELIKQPVLYHFTSDSGNPDHNTIMDLLYPTGILFDTGFQDELYSLIKGLKKFATEHHGKRYICLN